MRIRIFPDKEYRIQVIETKSNIIMRSRSIPLHFTTLPLVSLNADTVSIDYDSAAFRLLSREQTLSVPTAKIRWRGSSALALPKKSFGLKLTDGTEKMDLPLLGMRSDNSWILDAAAIDRSRMRNRVSFELWEDFSARPYQSEMEPMAKTSIQRWSGEWKKDMKNIYGYFRIKMVAARLLPITMRISHFASLWWQLPPTDWRVPCWSTSTARLCRRPR